MEYFQEESANIYPLAEMERRYITMVISLCEDNIPQAARCLGISPSTLYRKLAGWEGVSRRPRREETPG
jgi:two-component system repressor protein LuxO